MKIIILYASAGAGHRRAAEALYKELLAQGQKDVTLRDALDFTPAFYKKSYGQGYEFIVKYIPTLWAILFYVCDSPILKPLISFFRVLINSTNTSKLERFLKDQKPDVVVATQFLLSEVIPRMRRKGDAPFKFISVVTDFDVHFFWVSQLVDEYIVASEHTKEVLMNKFRISEERIKILGIPIDPHFNKPKDRQQLAAKFGIDSKKFTVLIIAGSFGMGPLKEIAKLLSLDNQVIIGCGKNKKLLEDLSDLVKTETNLKPIGFVDYVDELMVLSDVIITKPGGLTISESLAMGLPMIFISAIKGQETNNAQCMSQLHVGFSPRNIRQIPSLIKELRENPKDLEQIRSTIKSVARPASASEIAKHIIHTYGP